MKAFNKGQIAAAAFYSTFSEEFGQAIGGEETSFDISKKDFDEFLILYGLTNYSEVPEPGASAEWNHFVKQRNHARSLLNRSAEVGDYGGPPFRVDNYGKTMLRVQLLPGIVSVTPGNNLGRIKCLMESKSLRFERLDPVIQEHLHELPSHLQYAIDQAKGEYLTSTDNALHIIDNSLKRVNKLYKDALTFIPLTAPQKAALMPPDEDDGS